MSNVHINNVVTVEPRELINGILSQYDDKEIEQAKLLNYFDLGL